MKTDLIKRIREIQNKREAEGSIFSSPMILLLEAKGILTSDEVDDIIKYDEILYKNVHSEVRKMDLLQKKDLTPAEKRELANLTLKLNNLFK